MTFSKLDSPRQRHAVSARAINAYMQERGQKLWPQYSPTGAFVPIPADFGKALLEECVRYRDAPLDPLGMAAQIADETAGLQSKFWVERWNPGGIGAEDDNPDEAYHYGSMREGLSKHGDHLRSYVYGQGPWVANDDRASHMPAAWFGIVKTWQDLSGKWATALHYGNDIEAIGQRIEAIEAGLGHGAVAGEGRVPKPLVVTKYRSPNRDYTTPFSGRGVICHIATSNLSSNISWFMNPNANASANFETAKDGTIIEFVEAPHSAWAHGRLNHPDLSHPLIKAIVAEGVNPNTRARSIEHEGEAGDRLTPAQISSTSHLLAWIAQEDGWSDSIDADHITGHFKIDSVDRPYCPSFDPDEWQALFIGARAIRDHYKGGPVVDDTVRRFTDVGLPWELRGGFKDFYEFLESFGANLITAGFPASNEFDVNPPDSPRPGLPWRLASIARAVKMDRGGYMVWEPGEQAPYNFRLAAADQVDPLDDLFAILFPPPAPAEGGPA